MSDLDDLAAAASGGGTRGRQPASPPPAKADKPAKALKPATTRVAAPPPGDEGSIVYEQPVPGQGLSPMTWVGAGIVVVLLIAFFLINREREPAPTPLAQAARPVAGKGATNKAAATAGAPATAPTTKASAGPGAPGALGQAAGGTGAAAKAITQPKPVELKDFEDPAEAVEVYHLTRDGDTLDIRVRNLTRRGVYVKVLQFYPESDDKKPVGESIRFWLAPGMPLVATHPMSGLSDRLGEEEGVTAIVEEAEFADTLPDELKELAADEGADAAEEDDGSEQEEEEEPAPRTRKGKKKKSSKDE